MDKGVRAIVSHRLPNAEELNAGCGDWLECCQAYIHADECPARQGALLTTLKAAANYVCRATSDYYPADVRHTIIKALTYHIAAIEEADDDPAHWQERLLFSSDVGRNQQLRINQLERVTGLLLRYVDHQRGCTSYTNGPCTCGFESAMQDPAIAYDNSRRR